MKGSIQIGKTHLRNIGNEFSKIGAIVNFCATQLLAIHNANLGKEVLAPAATPYQLHAMLEALDDRIMDRETTIQELLGEIEL